MLCLTSAKFNMKADLLRQTSQNVSSIDISQAADWSAAQDPVSGEIDRRWVPITNDDPDTTPVEPYSIDCEVRSMVNYNPTRIQSGVGQKFGQDIVNMEYARMTYPPYIYLTERDRVTNVRGPDGTIIYRDEELEHSQVRATIFNVMAVIPVIDPFGNVTEYMAILQRAEVQ